MRDQSTQRREDRTGLRGPRRLALRSPRPLRLCVEGVLLAVAFFVLASAAFASAPPKPAPGSDPIKVQLLSSEAPTLLTHPKEFFRDIVRCFARYRGSLWFGTYGRGLFRVEGGKLESYRSGSSPLLEDRVNCLAVRGDELWIGTCAGINVLNARGQWRAIRESDGVAHHIYHAMLVDRRGQVWVGTTGKGLSRFDGSQWKTFRATDGLAGNWVNGLMEAGDGTLWAACSGGVSRFGPGGRWETLNGSEFPLDLDAVAVAEQSGALWVGFGTHGLFVLQGRRWLKAPAGPLPAPTVRALAVDGKGTLWIGTESGLATYDFATDWESRQANAGLEARDVRSLFYDRQEQALYLGTRGGQVCRRGIGEAAWSRIVDKDTLVRPLASKQKEAMK